MAWTSMVAILKLYVMVDSKLQLTTMNNFFVSMMIIWLFFLEVVDLVNSILRTALIFKVHELRMLSMRCVYCVSKESTHDRRWGECVWDSSRRRMPDEKTLNEYRLQSHYRSHGNAKKFMLSLLVKLHYFFHGTNKSLSLTRKHEGRSSREHWQVTQPSSPYCSCLIHVEKRR